MERERWDQVKNILSTYLDLKTEERSRYLELACAGNTSLLADVRRMLQSNAALGDFLETPLFDDVPEEFLTGRQIGNYLLREPIGQGGMATVYRAVRSSDYEKQVAIKLVKRGMDTDFILRRFRHERQILAGLDHPNIARLLDGGASEDGRPYLVMEYMEGDPITEYAERNSLKIQERLELFQPVCSAVQYAHQNLVVHRDLKPSNILVTADGVPKLLDFGIAKLLEADSGATTTSVRLMTPECASPEQVLGRPITTASDVYSLGVLLYQLLTGERPYQFSTRTQEEVARVVCETEPKKPGAVRPLAEDLDTIVLKAMQKDPARRYVSVEQFREDIGRYLAGLPVSARKDTFGYRARKFVGRHKAGSVAAALVSLSLAAGIGATLWESHVARTERSHAERRFEEVRQLADSLIFELHDAIQPLPGSTAARKLLLDRGLHYLDTLTQESVNDPILQRDSASAYERVGLIQGKYGDANLGDFTGALQSLQKALEIRQRIAASNPVSISDNRALADAYRVVAAQLMSNGANNDAMASIRKAILISEDLRKDGANDFETLRELSYEYDVYGLIQGGAPGSFGDRDGAVENFRKALEVDEGLLRVDPRSEVIRRSVEIDNIHLGRALATRRESKEALISLRKALEIARDLASGSFSAPLKRDVAVACNQIAALYEDLGDLKQALASYAEGRHIYVDLAAADPANVTARRGLAIADLNVGSMLVKTGSTRDGLALMDDAVRIDEALVAGDPPNSVERHRFVQFYQTRGEAREQSGMLTWALEDFRKASIALQNFADQNPGNTSAQLDAARGQVSAARVSARIGLIDQAAAGFSKALALSEKYGATDPESQWVSAEAYSGLGSLASVRGSDPTLPMAQRIAEWNASRSNYLKSLDVLQAMGSVRSTGISRAQVTAHIADCDRQLARLRQAIYLSQTDR